MEHNPSNSFLCSQEILQILRNLEVRHCIYKSSELSDAIDPIDHLVTQHTISKTLYSFPNTLMYKFFGRKKAMY